MRPWLVALLVLSLVGCGWHLRGSQSLSLDGQRIAIQDDTDTRPLVRTIADVLADLGAETVAGQAPADARVKLMRSNYTRRTVAGAGEDGITQYELSYLLRFQVLGPEGEPWSEPETVRTANSYEVDEASVLAGESRREELSAYLQEQAARLMAARLQAAIDRQRGGGE